jgi:hypothetical protein
MDSIQILWIFIFLFFALILIFTWSKMAIISGKVRTIVHLLDNISGKSKNTPEKKPLAGEEPPTTARRK